MDSVHWRSAATVIMLAASTAAGVACERTGQTGRDATAEVGVDAADSGGDTAGADDDTTTTDPDGGTPPDTRSSGDTAVTDADGGPDTTADSGGTDTSSPATPCGQLPMPEDAVTRVSADEANNLRETVQNAAAGTTVVLEAGTYPVHSQIQFNTDDVTLRSASGNPEDVVLAGSYKAGEILAIHASDVTIAHLTIKNAENHGIHITPPSGGPNVTGVRLYDLRLIDHGEQFVKVNPPGSDDAWVDDSQLECSYLEMTDAGRPHVERCCGGCYTGGIDAHAARGWVVRNNTFKGIYCAGEGLAEHAVHFWTASRGTKVEQNTIKNCARGVGFGLVESKDSARSYPDDPYPNAGYIGHYGGQIRNNVIWANVPRMDTGIELAQARGATIRHNTVFTTSSARDRLYSSIDYRFPNTKVTIENNLAQRISSRNNGKGSVDNNLESASPEMFRDPTSGDLHLQSDATSAIDKASSSGNVSVDIDGDERPLGEGPDIGADEVRP